jgi:Holliday junction resolvasome RuvABC endonuclease subunit
MVLRPPVEHTQTDAYDALGIALCDFYHQTGPEILKHV